MVIHYSTNNETRVRTDTNTNIMDINTTWIYMDIGMKIQMGMTWNTNLYIIEL